MQAPFRLYIASSSQNTKMSKSSTVLSLLRSFVGENALARATSPADQNKSTIQDVLGAGLSRLASACDSLEPAVESIPTNNSISLHARLSFLYDASGDASSPLDVRWRYTLSCVALIEMLVASFSRESDGDVDEDVLYAAVGLEDVRLCRFAVEMIVCLGVHPCLSAGVGVPVEQRASRAASLVLRSLASAPEDKNCAAFPTDRYSRLSKCMNALVPLATSTSLRKYVLAGSTSDVVAGLLQLVHEPLESYLEQEETRRQTEHPLNQQQALSESNLSDLPAGVTAASPADLRQQRPTSVIETRTPSTRRSLSVHAETQLDAVLASLSPSESLAILAPLGGTATRKAPEWIRRVSGALSSRTLMRNGGVAALASIMLSTSTCSPPGATNRTQDASPGNTRERSSSSGGGDAEDDMDGSVDDEDDRVDWKAFEGLARVVAAIPRQVASVEEYYAAVSVQVVDIFRASSRVPRSSNAYSHSQSLSRAMLCVLSRMMARNPALGRRLLLGPIVQPLGTVSLLLGLSAGIPHAPNNLAESRKTDEVAVDANTLSDIMRACGGVDDSDDIVIAESVLGECVGDLHRIVAMSDPSAALVDGCLQCVPPLFRLYAHCRRAPTSLRAPVHEILVALLRVADVPASVSALHSALFCAPTEGQGFGYQGDDLRYEFAGGPSGGVVLRRKKTGDTLEDGGSESDAEGSAVELEWLSACFIELLGSVAKEELSCEMFVRLLSDYTSAFNGTKDTETGHNLEVLPSREIVLRLVLMLAETLGPSLLKNATHTIAFANAMLASALASTRRAEESDSEYNSGGISGLLRREMMAGDSGDSKHGTQTHPFDDDQMETVSVSLALLSALIDDETRLNDAQSAQLLAMLPTLDAIAHNAQSGGAGHGAGSNSNSNNNGSRSATKLGGLAGDIAKEGATADSIDAEEGRSTLSTDIASLARDVRDRIAIHKAVAARKRAQSQMKASSEGQDDARLQPPESFTQVLSMLQDPLLPVRAHALMNLRKLLLRGDKEATANASTALVLFENALEDPDSYMYLTAINGLAAMADVMPRRTIPHLVREYADAKRPADTRLRIGEALLMAAERLGDVLPRHAGELLGAFFVGARDSDALVRASSLSNIGTAAGMLQHAIHPYVVEVLSCAGAVARHDRDAVVRRAAVHVILLMVRGMGSNIVHIVPDGIKEMYRLLKELAFRDQDEIVRSHANAALADLDEVFRSFCFPSQQ